MPKRITLIRALQKSSKRNALNKQPVTLAKIAFVNGYFSNLQYSVKTACEQFFRSYSIYIIPQPKYLFCNILHFPLNSPQDRCYTVFSVLFTRLLYPCQKFIRNDLLLLQPTLTSSYYYLCQFLSYLGRDSKIISEKLVIGFAVLCTSLKIHKKN